MPLRSKVPLAFLALAAACGDPGGDELRYFYFPDEVDLPPATYHDTSTPWVSVGILNETFFPLSLDHIEVTGPGARYLEIEVPGATDQSASLGVRGSRYVRVRVRPPRPAELINWTTTTDPFEAVLSFRVSGTAIVDPVTGKPDLTRLQVEKVEIPVFVSLQCDRDGDGHDALVCGSGGDCDDVIPSIHPGAREVCDGIDNDCDDVADDNGMCVDLDE